MLFEDGNSLVEAARAKRFPLGGAQAGGIDKQGTWALLRAIQTHRLRGNDVHS